jgi:Ulp1 family protease
VERKRFHFFNSFFYKKLTQVQRPPSPPLDGPAEKHAHSMRQRPARRDSCDASRDLDSALRHGFAGVCMRWLQELKSITWNMIQNHESEAYAQQYKTIKRWTKSVDVFEKDYLFVPIHNQLHWSLVLVVRHSSAP